MRDKSKLADQVAHGENARIALHELDKAFEALESDCFDSFRRSAPHDHNGRTMCSLYLRVMDDVKSRFQKAIRNGEAASEQLVKLEEQSKLKRMLKRV